MPLLYACIRNDTNMCKLLLIHGADPNCHDDIGTPLSCAVVNNNLEMVNDLLNTMWISTQEIRINQFPYTRLPNTVKMRSSNYY
jgi:ankyrin repeat protein